MRKKLIVSAAVLAVMGVMTACSPNAAQESTMESTVETTAEETTIPETGSAVSLEELSDMLGMDDAETADLFGGGEENWTEDRKFYIGRMYQAELYGEMLPVYTSCDDKKSVNSVSVWIANGDREVQKEEAETWTDRVTESTGIQPVYNETSSEAGSKNWKWVSDDKIISMHWLGNTLSINMNPAVGELK